MATERFPRGLGITAVIGGTLLLTLGIAVPRPGSDYVHQAPKVDVARIGVEARVSHGHGGGMEGSLAHAAEHTRVEASIFAAPGGRYTAADVARNGTVAPAERFEGIVSVHDMHPEKGARVCPITGTKANPKFAWSVDGRTYTFCCPPCIEEWVIRAKGAKAPLPAPETFVAR